MPGLFKDKAKAILITVPGKKKHVHARLFQHLRVHLANMAKALDLDFDASGALANDRFKRAAMIIEQHGIVTQAFEEPNKTGLSASLVEKHLLFLV
ncbi:hypothetical protein BC940DRAFT_369684 [Gongronella butleri]|nr:hypothetical protein BC940DRAFT_369684 [Gongronella butleri]